MRKKFTILQEGKKYKPDKGDMIVMNPDGVFFIIKAMNTYDRCIAKLSDEIGNYDVVWSEK